MKLTGDFLLNVLNSSLRRKHNNLVQKSIANNYTIHLQAELQELKKEQLYVDDDRYLNYTLEKILEFNNFQIYI